MNVMARNLKRYYYAWELRQHGKKLYEIADAMGFKSRENARRMIHYVTFLIEHRNSRKISNDLNKLLIKYKIY